MNPSGKTAKEKAYNGHFFGSAREEIRIATPRKALVL
jgi:hypothetical protein